MDVRHGGERPGLFLRCPGKRLPSQPNDRYVLTLTTKKGVVSATHSVKLRVVEEAVPSVSIFNPSPGVHMPNDRLVLEGVVSLPPGACACACPMDMG